MSDTTISSSTSSGNFTVNDGDVVSVFGTATDFLVNSGGQEIVFAGGTAIGTTATGSGMSGVGGEVIVSGGGTTSFTTVSNGGYESLSGGGNSAVSTTVGSDSYIRVFSGGTLLGTTVNSGGSDYVYSGVASNTTLNGAGTFEYVAGGSAVSTTVNSGATQELYNSGVATPTTVNSGGTQLIYAGGSAVSTTVSKGGFQTISSGGSATSTTVDNGGTEVIYSGGTATDTILSSGGSIDVTYLDDTSGGTASVNSSTDVLTISAGGQVYTQQLSGDYTGEFFHLTPDTGSGTLLTANDSPACYCHGTRLLTDHGEVAVEHLAIGDRLRTANGSLRPIRWIGYRHLDLHRHPAPEQVQPILIRTNAVADGVPGRDLRVSPDHAVLLGGMLIPARLLINGASIQRETRCRTVTYYHVELETHDILLAEALPAESYLDTGNRGIFENAGTPMVLHPDLDDGQQRRAAKSCRPFVDDAASLEPIWHRLAMRATRLGLDLPASTDTTSDPALRVVVNGRAIAPVSGDAGRYTFLLPATRGPIRLVSRAVRPCDVRPWVEDRRRLGVMMSRLTLTRATNIELIPLDHPHLSRGWWDIERDGAKTVRWTDGNATIPLSLAEPAILDVLAGGALDYPLDRDTEASAREPVAA